MIFNSLYLALQVYLNVRMNQQHLDDLGASLSASQNESCVPILDTRLFISTQAKQKRRNGTMCNILPHLER